MHSRSTSASSRGHCKDCGKKVETWRGHPCMRHAACMDDDRHLWNPDNCDICFQLLGDTTNPDKTKKQEARHIVLEILRGAEAVAQRRSLEGFVTLEIYNQRFQPWMGAFYKQRVIRPSPRTASSSPRKRSSMLHYLPSARASLPPCIKPRDISPPTDPPVAGPSTSYAPESPPSGYQRSRSPSYKKGKRLPTRDAKSPSRRGNSPPSKKGRVEEASSSSPVSRRPTPPSKQRERTSPARTPSPMHQRSPAPPRRSRSLSSHSPSPGHDHRSLSPNEIINKYDRETLNKALQAFRQREKEDDRHRRSRSRQRRTMAQPRRSVSSSASRSPRRRRERTPLSRYSRESPPPSLEIRQLSPSSPYPSGASYSEDEAPRGTSDIPLTQTGEEEASTSHQRESEDVAPSTRLPETDYYWLTSDAHIDVNGLTMANLPPVPQVSIHRATIAGRQAVAFLNPNLYPAIEYICRLRRTGVRKESSPSQRDFQRALNQVVHAHEGQDNFSWSVEDPLSPESAFVIKQSPTLEEYAHTMSQPKGFGDEGKRLPPSPVVPIRSEGPKLQNLISFLEAGSLSPTSHKIGSFYSDRRTTREPPKSERDTDHEYRRAARSALGIKMAWELMRELAESQQLDAPSKVRAFTTVLDVFQKDVTCSMDYQVTRAVHQRRNLIDFSTKDMPQEDIKLRIQELPLPTGNTLFHEDAAAKVEESLLRPQGRQLQPIREREPRKHGRTTWRRGDGASFQEQPRPSIPRREPSPAHQPPQRKRTKPSHPVAPSKHPRPDTAKGNGKGNGQPRKFPKATAKPSARPFASKKPSPRDNASTKQ